MQIQCPQGHLLEVPEAHAGKKVQCPACQTIMVVPFPPAGRPRMAELVDEPRRASRDDDRSRRGGRYDDEPEEEVDEFDDERAARREGLLKVRTGLGFHLAKVYVAIIGAILLVVLGFVMAGQLANQAQGNPRGFGGAAQVLGKAMPLIVLGVIYRLLVSGLGFVGSIFCLAAPARSGAKGFIIAAIVCDVVALLIGLGVEFMQPGQTETAAMGWAAILVSVAGFFCFFQFLRKIAEFKKKRWLADQTSSVMWFAVIIVVSAIVGGIVAAVLVAAAGPVGGLLLAILFIGVIIAGLIWLIRYVRLLSDFRAVLP